MPEINNNRMQLNERVVSVQDVHVCYRMLNISWPKCRCYEIMAIKASTLRYYIFVALSFCWILYRFMQTELFSCYFLLKYRHGLKCYLHLTFIPSSILRLSRLRFIQILTEIFTFYVLILIFAIKFCLFLAINRNSFIQISYYLAFGENSRSRTKHNCTIHLFLINRPSKY